LNSHRIIPNPTSSANAPKDHARFFYAGASILLLVLVFLGFRLFYLHGKAFPGRPLTPPIRNLLIAHGVAMSAWVILLVIQPLLIVNRKYQVHMLIGRIGAVLAACIVFLGLRVAVAAATVNPPDLKLWGLVPKQFMAIPICAIVMFAGYVAIGLWNRRRPEVHRPMMLLGTLTVTAAALDRIGAITHLYAHSVWGATFGPFFAPTVIGVAFLLVKWALTRSIDRSYAAGYAVLVIVGPLTMKLAPTQAWDGFASFLLR
jgi:hypothetical protein